MTKKRITPNRPVNPSPAALITSADANGKANIITLGEVFNISIQDPVIVGIAIRPSRYSHALISASREFVVNLPTAAIVQQVVQCGKVSGRELDKFAVFGLTALPAATVGAPLIAECPVNIECKVLSIQTVGDHDLFLGEALAVHVDEDKLDGEDRCVTEKLDPLIYLNRQFWSIGTQLKPLR